MSDLLQRAQRRAGRILRELVPHNLHYKPNGVHTCSQELAAQPGSKITYHQVHRPTVSHLTIPKAFYEQASIYPGMHHGKPNSTEQVPATFTVEIEQGRLYADNWDSVAIITEDGKLLGDVSFQHARKTWSMLDGEGNNIFQQRYFLEPVQVKGTVCSLLGGGGAAMGNYYHWLIDSLPRLHLVQKAGLLESVDYFLVYNKANVFVRESLLAAGIREDQLIDVNTHRHLRADRLIVTSAVRGHGRHTPAWACNFLRSTYLPVPVGTRRFGPNIYISRRDANMRHVLNEDKLQPLLAEFGFTMHTLSDLSFLEKVSLFSGARMVVGPVGAGMANLMFTPPGTPLLELLPDGFTVPEDLDLTARLELPYHWLVCPSSQQAASFYQARHSNLVVNLAQFRAVLTQVMEKSLQAMQTV